MLLSDICEIIMGQSPSSDSYNVKGQGLPFFQGNADFGKLYPSVRLWCNCPIKKAEAGDLLVSVRAPIGAVNLANQKCCIGRGLAALRPYRDKCDAMYLYYLIKAGKNKLNWLGTGSTFKAITRSSLLSFNVPDYCIALQRKISGKLWSVDKLIHQRNEQLKLFDLLIQSRFLEMFGDIQHNSCKWDIEPLSAVCHKITDGEHGSVQRVSEGYVYLNAKNIRQDGNIDWENITHISFKDHAKIFKRCNPEPDDILLTTTGTVGNIAIVPKVGPFSIDRGITLLKINNDRLNNIYLANLLNSEYLQQCMKNNIHASAIGHLFLKQVKSLSVMLPPLHLQNQFADYVVHIDKSKYRGTISLHLLEDVSHML